jgi:hypothetical protein
MIKTTKVTKIKTVSTNVEQSFIISLITDCGFTMELGYLSGNIRGTSKVIFKGQHSESKIEKGFAIFDKYYTELFQLEWSDVRVLWDYMAKHINDSVDHIIDEGTFYRNFEFTKFPDIEGLIRLNEFDVFDIDNNLV